MRRPAINKLEKERNSQPQPYVIRTYEEAEEREIQAYNIIFILYLKTEHGKNCVLDARLSRVLCGGVRSVTDAMASEEDEVRALLMRHRKQIIRDFNESKLIAVLTQKGVLNVSSERLFNEISSAIFTDQSEKYGKIVVDAATTTTTPPTTTTSPIIENVTNPTTTTTNGSDILSNTEINEKKCTFLIDVISKNGFDKFKEFCYAIESECPQLIEDLINDRIKGGKLIVKRLRAVRAVKRLSALRSRHVFINSYKVQHNSANLPMLHRPMVIASIGFTTQNQHHQLHSIEDSQSARVRLFLFGFGFGQAIKIIAQRQWKITSEFVRYFDCKVDRSESCF